MFGLHTVGMSISVQYSSTRREVWSDYSRMWRERLWKLHFFVFGATSIFASFWIFGGWPNDIPQVGSALLMGLVPLLLLAIYPMMMFKPQRRLLTVTSDGISTTIGKHNKKLDWAEIADVRNSDDALIIQNRNLNAFIVPARTCGEMIVGASMISGIWPLRTALTASVPDL